MTIGLVYFIIRGMFKEVPQAPNPMRYYNTSLRKIPGPRRTFHREPVNQISTSQYLSRKILTEVGKRVLPTGVVEEGNGLSRVRELNKEGRDVFVMTTHPSETDEPREYPIIWGIDSLSHTKTIVPNAADQMTLPARALAAATGISLHEVVTPGVAARDKSFKHGLRYGNVSYYKDIKRSTGDETDPGNVFLAPDAMRRPDLSGDEKGNHTRAGEFLLTAGGSNSVTLLIAVEIVGVTDYKKSSGKNIGKEYIIHVGDAFTNQEIIAKLKEFREMKGLRLSRKDRPFEHFDQWLFEAQFPKIAPKNYLA